MGLSLYNLDQQHNEKHMSTEKGVQMVRLSAFGVLHVHAKKRFELNFNCL